MNDVLQPGDVVNVPNKEAETIKEVDEKYSYYTVLPKEGFYRIKLKTGLTQEDLEKLNPKLEETGLKEGMVLKIPFKGSNSTIEGFVSSMTTNAGKVDLTKSNINPETKNSSKKAFNKLTDENQALIDEVAYRANYDQLTGLPKRNLLFTELEKSIVHLEIEPQMHGLYFLDLDGFKQANDEFGHDAGDEILKVVAKRMQSLIRKEDIPARFGGDEFVILALDLKNETNAANLAENLLESIRNPISISENRVVMIDSSIGLKIYDQENRLTVDQLIKEADSAMYVAKRRGKGTWVLA